MSQDLWVILMLELGRMRSLHMQNLVQPLVEKTMVIFPSAIELQNDVWDGADWAQSGGAERVDGHLFSSVVGWFVLAFGESVFPADFCAQNRGMLLEAHL